MPTLPLSSEIGGFGLNFFSVFPTLNYNKVIARYGFGYNKEQPKDTSFSYIKTINDKILHKRVIGSRPLKRNMFFHSSLSSLGGSEERAINIYKHYGRFGGNHVDSIVYLHNFDRPDFKSKSLTKSPLKYCESIFGMSGVIDPGDILFSIMSPDVPTDTSPGIAYKRLGFRKKADAIPLARKNLKIFYDNIGTTNEKPLDLLWCVGGRPKLKYFWEAANDVSERKGVGRAIWISDIEEAILSRHFTKDIDRNITGNPLLHHVMINFDKVKDRSKLKSFVDKYDAIFEADYSKFDSSIPTDVVEMAFDVFRCLFTNIDNKTEWFYKEIQRNFLSSYVDLGDGRLVYKNSGIPSGSGLTSIIGSICNCLMVETVMNKLNINNQKYGYLVYGDDLLIGLNNDLAPGLSHFGFRRKFCDKMSNIFNVTIKKSEAKVTRNKYVRIATPHYTEDTTFGTSLLKPSSITYSDLEPEQGTYSLSSSHRWWYDFSKTWKFLGYSMLPDGRLIRPTVEVLARIYNPEKEVKSWDDHVTLLKMALLENYDNSHTRNRIYHYLLDVYWVLSKTKNKTEIPDTQWSIQNGRASYRYQTQWSNLMADPLLIEFNDFWIKLDYNIDQVRRNCLSFSDSYFYLVKRNRISQAILDVHYNSRFSKDLLDNILKLGFQPPIKTKAFYFGTKFIEDEFDLKDCLLALEFRTDYYQKKLQNSINKLYLLIKEKYEKKYIKTFKKPKKNISNIDIFTAAWKL